MLFRGESLRRKNRCIFPLRQRAMEGTAIWSSKITLNFTWEECIRAKRDQEECKPQEPFGFHCIGNGVCSLSFETLKVKVAQLRGCSKSRSFQVAALEGWPLLRCHSFFPSRGPLPSHCTSQWAQKVHIPLGVARVYVFCTQMHLASNTSSPTLVNDVIPGRLLRLYEP